MDSAVRIVLDISRQDPQRPGAVCAVGDLMGIHPEVLRRWVKKAKPAPAVVPTAPSALAAVPGEERIQCLERENADLRRANEVLKAAAVLFAVELQPRRWAEPRAGRGPSTWRARFSWPGSPR